MSNETIKGLIKIEEKGWTFSVHTSNISVYILQKVQADI